MYVYACALLLGIYHRIFVSVQVLYFWSHLFQQQQQQQQQNDSRQFKLFFFYSFFTSFFSLVGL